MRAEKTYSIVVGYIRLGEPVPRLPLKWRAGRGEGFAQVKCLENRTDRWDGLFMGVVMP
ncbi:MAG TPA: hypothetical protein DEF41_02495 [Desulfovibrio sp.]|nr:hypothetical protein [Desulfovibrio sp.]